MAKERFGLFETAKILKDNRGADFNFPYHGQFLPRHRLATGKPVIGYILAFAITAVMLSRIDVSAFKQKAVEPSFAEEVAVAAK